MSNTQSQAEAGSGKEVTETPQGVTDSLQQPGKEQTFEERRSGASSQADVLRLIDDAKAGRFTKPAEEAKAPAAETNGAPVTDGDEKAGQTTEATKAGDGEVAATAAEATDGTAAAGGEQSEEEKKATEEAQAQAAADDAAKKQSEELPDRIRLTNFSKVEKLALTIKKENPKLSLAEAEAKARDALGIVETKTSTTDDTTSALPKTAAEVDAKIKDLVAQRTKAFKDDLDFTAGDRLTNEIEALREHKLTLREQGAQKASQEQETYNAAYDASEKKASGLYDFMKQADSAGFKRMAEIDRQLKENGDALFDSPDKPLVIAQMVAKELQIAPKSPTAKAATTIVKTVAAKPAVTTDASKKIVSPVASGASRTTTASTQGDGLGKKIAALRTPQDVENFVSSLGT